MINIKDKEDCVGCSACVQRCPQQCISLEEDAEGFVYPVVNKENCINCGLCEKVCPVLYQNESPKKPLQAYAAINPNEQIRLNSSSGGIFTMLAESVIKQNGVVFGASFDSEWNVRHEVIRTLDGLNWLRGSKYVQSNIGHTYSQTERLLKKGTCVLFSGTPCQIAGLKRFLRKDYDNLLTVDFICHGVPSPGVWRWYLSCHNATFIKDIKFRDKSEGWRNFRFVLEHTKTFADGKSNNIVLSSLKDENGFMKAFLNNISLRPSCYVCPCKSGKSNSDITIADFWGIENFDLNLDDDKGTSLVLANSIKGVHCIDEIKAIKEKVVVEDALLANSSWDNPSCRHELHDYFFLNYRRNSCNFNQFVDDLICTKSLTKRIVRKIFRFMGYKQLPL